MIQRKTSWLRILLRVRGTAFARTWGRVLFVTLVSVFVTYADLEYHLFHYDLSPLPFSLVGVALGIFLGFRNNTSYDRFWEGRKLWGRLVNTSRSLTRQVLTLVGSGPGSAAVESPVTYRISPHGHEGEPPGELADFQRDCVYHLMAYVHALRLHLRNEKVDELDEFLPDGEVDAYGKESNPPIAILQTLGNRFRWAWDKGWVHAMHLPVLEQSLTDLADIQGGCERIKATPIPFSYTVLIHRIVAVYCFTLPFGLVNAVDHLTPVVVAIISYAFFGLDAVGEEIENPFEHDPNDLPLSRLSKMIEINLRERLGETELPSMPEPVNDVMN